MTFVRLSRKIEFVSDKSFLYNENDRRKMTDQEIIQGLINRDNRVTEEFFFVQCRPVFIRIMQNVFDYNVEYDEMVNELYVYLMEDDANKLRQFQYRSSV